MSHSLWGSLFSSRLFCFLRPEMNKNMIFKGIPHKENTFLAGNHEHFGEVNWRDLSVMSTDQERCF